MISYAFSLTIYSLIINLFKPRFLKFLVCLKYHIFKYFIQLKSVLCRQFFFFEIRTSFFTLNFYANYYFFFNSHVYKFKFEGIDSYTELLNILCIKNYSSQ
jgi:hypothetical protein